MTESSAQELSAEAFAEKYRLPYLTQPNNHYTQYLIFTAKGLVLQNSNFKKPFILELENPGQQYRYRQSQPKKELLAKAVGLNLYKNKNLWVCDLTAGFGQDAYLLHLWGCRVDLVERSPVIASLLQQALDKTASSLSVNILEAENYLAKLKLAKEKPQVLYLDPMFPEKNKTALVNKSAQLLQALAGKEEAQQSAALLQQALSFLPEVKRVVLKRPRTAPLLISSTPDLQVFGKTIRFDVYTKSKLMESKKIC